MARMRTIKPETFTNEKLAGCSLLTRVAFPGLWCHADREGRLEDRPRRLASLILPYDHDADFDAILNELAVNGFLIRYAVAGNRYIQIVNFPKHQRPHPREGASEIPAVPRPRQGHASARKRRGQAAPGCVAGSAEDSISKPLTGTGTVRGTGTGTEARGSGARAREAPDMSPPPPAPLVAGSNGQSLLAARCPPDLEVTAGMIAALGRVGCLDPPAEARLYVATMAGKPRAIDVDWTEHGRPFTSWLDRHDQMGCVARRRAGGTAQAREDRTLANMRRLAGGGP